MSNTSALKYTKHVSTQARKHAKNASTQRCTPRDLADSLFGKSLDIGCKLLKVLLRYYIKNVISIRTI